MFKSFLKRVIETITKKNNEDLKPPVMKAALNHIQSHISKACHARHSPEPELETVDISYLNSQ